VTAGGLELISTTAMLAVEIPPHRRPQFRTYATEPALLNTAQTGLSKLPETGVRAFPLLIRAGANTVTVSALSDITNI
jgi:hypothetical protein